MARWLRMIPAVIAVVIPISAVAGLLVLVLTWLLPNPSESRTP